MDGKCVSPCKLVSIERTNGKISSEAQGFIFLFFLAAGYLLAYQPEESKRVAGAIAGVIIAIIDALKKILLVLINKK